MDVTPGAVNAAMNCVAAMVIDEISTLLKMPPEKAASAFLASDTANQLFDDSLKLWWDGPSTIVDDYLEEISQTA